MGTTADKLQKILDSKAAIKAAIEAKGVTDVGDKLSDYPAKIESISGGSSKIKLNGTKFAYSRVFDPTLYDTSEVTDMQRMFYYTYFSTIDLSSWDFSKVTTLEKFLYYNTNVQNINFGNANFEKVVYFNDMFFNCSALTDVDLSNCSFGATPVLLDNLFNSCVSISNIILPEIKVSSFKQTFMYCGITSIDLSKFDTSACYDMQSLFYNCTNLTNINMSTFDTSKVSTMKNMFSQCSNLETITVPTYSYLIHSNCTNTEFMFYNCNSLEYLIINADTSGVTSMSAMFRGCFSLASLCIIDLGHNETCTSLDVSDCPITDVYNFIIYNVFDRATAGYTKAFTLTLNSTTKAALTDEQIAEATAKGFTIA